MMVRTYPSPEAFKQALEQHLRTSAKSGAEFARRRQLLVFDRFLARVVAVLGDTAMLKGGLVLELRLERARTTKDVDLRMVASSDDILAKLQEAARRALPDFMTFEVGPDEDHPEIQNDGMQYDGLRFPCRVQAGRQALRAALRSRRRLRRSDSRRARGRRGRRRPRLRGHLRRRPCASTRSRRTLRRSSTRTRCRADARTRA
jgi:hypothetical protein